MAQYSALVRATPMASMAGRRAPGMSVSAVRAFSVSTEQLESLGDSITTAVLVSWNKEAGDAIFEDDVIAVVETDKVTMDIRAKKNGVMTEQMVEIDAEIEVGADLYKMDTSAVVGDKPAATPAAVAAAEEPPAAAASGPEERLEVPVPVMGESITQGVIAEWSVAQGDYVELDQIVASIETDKVTVDVRAPSAGVILEMYAAEDDEVEVDKPLFAMDTNAAAPTGHAAPAAVPAAAPKAAAAAAPKAAAATVPKAAPAAPASSGGRGETRVKMTRMRLRIAERLKDAQNTAAMLTTFQECDMTNLIALRNLHKEVKTWHSSPFFPRPTCTNSPIPKQKPKYASRPSRRPTA